MWAAQFMGFEEPNRWMTSRGLGNYGYGFPASIGIQIAHPNLLLSMLQGSELAYMQN